MSRSGDIIAFVEKYLIVPEGGAVGQPMRLRPWQQEIVAGIYDGTAIRRAIVSMARKNGKTGLSAMLLLAHLVGPEARRNAQIYSTALSRDQAALVFGMAAKMVRMSRELHGLVKVGDTAKTLFCPSTGVRYRALSADATTAYGLSPILAIHDELGQVRGPRSELYDAIESAMSAQDEPLSIIISTQAPTDGDLLSLLIDDAMKHGSARTRVFLYTAPTEDDPWAEATWRQANPALGDFCSLAEMHDLAETARRLPAQEASFRNLNLNQRVEPEGHFISQETWAFNGGEPDLSVLDKSPVFVGVDLSATQDLTAVVAVARSGGIWHVRPWFFLPGEGLVERARHDRMPYDVWAQQGHIVPIPGSRSIDEDFIARFLAPVLRRLDIRGVAYDRWQFESLRKAFSRAGYEPPFLEDFGQGFKTMTPALKALETVLLAGQMRHGNHPVLTMCAANTRVVTDDAGNRKLTKKRATGRIDGMVALTMAIGRAWMPVSARAAFMRRSVMSNFSKSSASIPARTWPLPMTVGTMMTADYRMW
jgi:phage terminase large subunit-like protein